MIEEDRENVKFASILHPIRGVGRHQSAPATEDRVGTLTRPSEMAKLMTAMP
jgi:hypothetical protein